MRRFEISVGQDALDDLRRRLDLFRRPHPAEERGWADRIDLSYLEELLAHWREGFAWRAEEARLNGLCHNMADVGGTTLHFVHERGRGRAPFPLFLVHGWAGRVPALRGAHPAPHRSGRARR